MKYKVLLAGSNKRVITDFFFQLDFSFECISSSMIYDDLKNHVRYFKPDAFVFCMSSESRDDVVSVANFHAELTKNHIPYVIIGDSSSIDFANKIPGGMPELELKSALAIVDISEQLSSFIEKEKAKLQPQATKASSASNAGSAKATDTSDIMSQIDAEIQAMEKVGATGASFGNNVRQPETPGRHRVLVIDDATIVHKAIKGYLDAEYEVATAISGKIALRYLQTKEVSLILLDYEMPEMDGPSVLLKLRSDPALATIPVVFLTGINDVEKIKKAFALKPQGYLLKPVDKNALKTKLHEIIK